MHTTLITGGTKKQREDTLTKRLDELGVSQFDRVTLTSETPSIGIADVRTFIQRLSLKPHDGTVVCGIIPESDRLTVEAQQALLKTLEEPPSGSVIMLAAQSTAILLPTILSRCACVTLPSEPETDDGARTMEMLDGLLTSRPGEIIRTLSAVGKTKEEAVAFISAALEALEPDIRANGSGFAQNKAALFHALIEAKRHSANNVSALSLLEHAFLKCRSTDGPGTARQG